MRGIFVHNLAVCKEVLLYISTFCLFCSEGVKQTYHHHSKTRTICQLRELTVQFIECECAVLDWQIPSHQKT